MEQQIPPSKDEEFSEMEDIDNDVQSDDDVIFEDVEEIAEHADDKIDALINLLVRKGIITEDEINEEYEKLYSEDEE